MGVQAPALGVSACQGSTPGRWLLPAFPVRRSGPGQPGAGSSPCPAPTVPPAARVAAFALCSAAPGGGSGAALRARPVLGCRGGLGFVTGGGGSPGRRSVVSVQRVRGTPLPRVPVCRVPPACAHLAASLPVCPRLSWPPGSGVTPFSHQSCCADGWGRGGVPRAGGPGPIGGGQSGRWSAPTHPCSSSGVTGSACRVSGRHLRRR